MRLTHTILPGPVVAGALAGATLLALTTATALTAQQPTGEEVDAGPDVVPAHVHLRHVAETFRGTPEGMGLLPTALAEAEVAVQHATLAARDPSDLEAMQRHAGHVLHALDPSKVEDGPGHGYGMIRAAERTAHYVELSLASEGGGDAVQTHGPHVATAARSAVAMAEAAVEAAEGILEAETAEQAAEYLDALTAGVDGLANGIDADGDGSVGWQEGEGGLAQAQRHLGLLMRGEGLAG